MSSTGGYGLPGQGAGSTTVENEFIWGGDDRQLGILRRSIVLSSTTADAANTPTTDIRKGLLLGKITSTGEFAQWDASATDGTENIQGILSVAVRSIDFNGSSVDRAPPGIIVKAPVIARRLFIKGAAFVGHADEYLARQQLHLAGCVLDDDPFGYLAGVSRRTVVKTSAYTVLATDNGTRFTTLGAVATVAFTLPATIQRGMKFTFYNEADQDMSVAGATGTLVYLNDLAANSVTFGTSSEKIGGCFIVEANSDATKWLVTTPVNETQTVTVAT